MDELTRHLLSLAQSGETMLLTRQTLRKPLHYYADGVPAATFPAFLPQKAEIHAGESWYINTGKFKKDRLDRVSASKHNIENVAFMVFDDVGTKSETPPIKPTYILETSPGNFQYGFVFSEAPHKHHYVAAYNAIARAGYSDPGANNPVRNVRIPGSVNLKKGKNGFVARLVEFNKGIEYTLEEICELLGVAPDERESGNGQTTLRLKDTGTDIVLSWLNEQSLVYAPPNYDGWVSVQCPNHASHSDGNPEARYLPATRGFHCFHGGCQHLDSRAFLKWVCDNGGPNAEYGLRGDLIAAAMAGLSNLTPTEAFPDPASVELAIRKAYAGFIGDDFDNGKAFAAMFRGKLLHIPEKDEVLQFSPDTGWLKTNREKVRLAASMTVIQKIAADASRVRDDEILRGKLLKRASLAGGRLPRLTAMATLGFAEPGMWASAADFDADPTLLGVRNGVLRLDTGELMRPAPDLLISKRANVAFDPDARCPQFLAFLERVQPDAGVRRLLQHLTGVALWGGPLVQKIVFMHGHGANGKSTFMETLAFLLGDYAAAIPTEMLMQGQRSSQGASPDLMLLKGARLAFCNETGEGRRLDAAQVKQLTGGDTITARPPYGQFISFAPSHLLVMTGNHKPFIDELGEGLWRRMLLIDWPVTIPEDQRDVELPDRLRAEAAGILNWALVGLKDFLTTRRFAIPESVAEATAAYRSEQDILGAWFEERMIREDGARMDTQSVYFNYRDWCSDNGCRPMTKRSLTRRLEERGVKRGGNGRAFYLGVRLVGAHATSDVLATAVASVTR